MKRHFFLFVCLLTLLSDRAIAEKAPKAVQAGVDDILKRHSMPGGVAAIVENGRTSLIVASGLRKHGDTKPFTVDDKVHIGSCTKAMTATLVGMLIDEGKLSWDTKITDVFPEFAEQLHEDYRPVTISQLLSHYSGAPANVVWRGLGSGDSVQQQRLTMMRQVFFQKPDHPPGKKLPVLQCWICRCWSNAGKSHRRDMGRSDFRTTVRTARDKFCRLRSTQH